MIDVIMLVTWIISGMLTLCMKGPVPKLSYFAAWLSVVLFCISRVVNGR